MLFYPSSKDRPFHLGTFPLEQSVVLLAWAAVATALTARTFKWE